MMNTRASPTVALHLLIRGRVQGVAFRASLREQAIAHGLSGWTRNLSDGSVEAVVSGSATAVEAILRWAACGPIGARVDRVESEACPIFAGAGFEIRASG
ncbi:MAG: acylphosphatase [Burkholderiaceae bacterium]|nr:acylphosphatase [Burkholderiaceae bacterium]